jgi:hypothetical protein
MFEKAGRSVRLFSFRDDQPHELRGSLIPQSVKIAEKARSRSRVFSVAAAIGVPVALFAMAGVAATMSYRFLHKEPVQLAAPIVSIVDQTGADKTLLGYGPQEAFSQDAFFSKTQDALIDQSVSFIEVDLDAKTLRYFDKGVLAVSADINAVGEEGSWWDAPSGLYKVEKKEEQEFSTVAQVYFPWAITFEGNYAIHGQPTYPGDKAVSDDFKAGGIRIDTKVAEQLYGVAEEGMAVLVHKKPKAAGDSFVYEPAVTGVTAPYYLIADIDNGSVLAASDLNVEVPIASLTKLMTAVVAAEKLNLDTRVEVTSPTFVESLIPRLKDRTNVSMYSLMQLLLVESSNESAEVIAGQYGRDKFVDEMNNKAKQLGMLSSKFVDPSGLGPENTSSLGDLFRLSQYIHNNRQFIFDITANGSIPTIEGFNEFADLQNFNQVKNDDSFVGGKVGETMAAGKTSVSLHKVQIQGSDRTVIIILLGSANRTDDVHTLLSYVQEHFKH